MGSNIIPSTKTNENKHPNTTIIPAWDNLRLCDPGWNFCFAEGQNQHFRILAVAEKGLLFHIAPVVDWQVPGETFVLPQDRMCFLIAHVQQRLPNTNVISEELMCGKINAESCILHDPTLSTIFRFYVLSCATAKQHPESNSVALQRESEINMFYSLK